MRIREFFFMSLLFTAMNSGMAQNQVLHFDGINDMVNLGGDVGNSVRSIELWFKPAYDIYSWNNERITLVTRNADDQDGEFGIYIGHDFLGEQGRITFTRQIDTIFHYIYSDDYEWIGGQWYHVAAVIDPAQGMLLYIDGILQGDTDPSIEATGIQTEMTTLGCWGDKLNRWFEGEMDEVRFWDRAISFEEINENICDTLDLNTTTGLLGYWRMNEGQGHTVKNYIESGRDADIFGSTYLADPLCFPDKIRDIEIQDPVSIIPNPIDDQALVIFPNDKKEQATFEIFDSIGRSLDIYQTNTNSLYISRNELKTGVYFYTLKIGLTKLNGKLIFK